MNTCYFPVTYIFMVTKPKLKPKLAHLYRQVFSECKCTIQVKRKQPVRLIVQAQAQHKRGCGCASIVQVQAWFKPPRMQRHKGLVFLKIEREREGG